MKKMSLFSYSFQSFYLAGAFLLFFVLLPSFYNLGLGIALSSIGIIIMISRISDVFTDFFIGYLSEKRIIKKKNKKNQFILGVILFLFSITGLFIFQSESIINLIIFYNLGLLSFTIAIIPYDSIVLDQKKISRGRFKLAAFKEAFAILGVIFALIIPAIIAYFFKVPFLDPNVIKMTGLFFVFCGVIGIFIFHIFFIEEKNFVTTKISFQIILQNIKHNKKILSLANITFFNLLANNFTANLFIIFVSTYLNLIEYVGLLLTLYFITTFLSIPVWYLFGKKYSNLYLLQTGLLISIIGFSLILFLNTGDLFLYIVVVLITGIGIGVDLIIPQAELADILDKNKKNNRLSQSFTTLFSIIKKFSIGLAAGIALSGYGFLNENDISLISGIPNIMIFYFFIPLTLKCVVMLLLFRYRRKYNDSSTA